MNMYEEYEENGELKGGLYDRKARIDFLRQGLVDNGGDVDLSNPRAESIILKQYVQENVLTSKEACELLHVSRQRLFAVERSGKLIPIIKTPHGNFYLKSDIIKFCKNKKK